MHIRPLQDRLLVKRVDTEGTTAGGIIIPDAAREKPQEAVVVAAGPGRTIEPGHVIAPAVKVGDRVLFSKYGGTEVSIGNVEYLIIREDDIFGVVEDE